MTNPPRLNHVQCLDNRGLHRMAYWEWGEPDNPHAVICVHGLTRQGRDFDTLARELSRDVRVVCPDVVGRGHSDWLADPMHYGIPQYVADMVTLLARLDVPQVDWVGTSMGGLIGLMLAALPSASASPPPVRRLVLNDIGPVIQAEALTRIGSFLGQPAHWPTLEAAADAIWAISQGFGPHTRDEWLSLTRPQLKADGAGFKPHYDPGIARPFKAATPELAALGEVALWAAYDRITAPTLLLRGEHSDLLAPETSLAMTQRGPRAHLHTFPGVGHAPTLVAAVQRAVVRDFLSRP